MFFLKKRVMEKNAVGEIVPANKVEVAFNHSPFLVYLVGKSKLASGFKLESVYEKVWTMENSGIVEFSDEQSAILKIRAKDQDQAITFRNVGNSDLNVYISNYYCGCNDYIEMFKIGRKPQEKIFREGVSFNVRLYLASQKNKKI